MADALCGPSNALQNFQKHASTDRTLQQDRLTSRQNPTQSFRTNGLNAGLLDPEFESFQAGHAPGQLVQQNPHFEPRFQPQIHTHPPPPTAGWASDFQNLHISSPPPQQQFHHNNVSRQAPASASSWQSDFMRQHSAPPPPQQSYASPMFGQSYGMQQNYMQQSMFQNQPLEQEQYAGKGKAVQQDAAFDEAAFERAFEAAHASMLEEVAASTTQQDTSNEDKLDQYTTDSNQEILNNLIPNSTEQISSVEAQKAQIRPDEHQMMAEAFNQPEVAQVQSPQAPLTTEPAEQPQQDPPAHSDEELAQTAGRLLDAVADNTSDKFAQSSFFNLMRRLRDHEVRVEGETMVEVNPTPTTDDPMDVSATRMPPEDAADLQRLMDAQTEDVVARIVREVARTVVWAMG